MVEFQRRPPKPRHLALQKCSIQSWMLKRSIVLWIGVDVHWDVDVDVHWVPDWAMLSLHSHDISQVKAPMHNIILRKSGPQRTLSSCRKADCNWQSNEKVHNK